MSPTTPPRATERPPEDAPAQDRRERDQKKDIWDVNPNDPEVDQRVIITDWAAF